MDANRTIAYFTMEIALEAGMPTYSGGLGVLAGDTVRSASDLSVPMVVVTLLHRKGYFYQRLDGDGTQHDEAVAWAVPDFLKQVDARVTVEVEGRTVTLGVWRYKVRGKGGHTVPVYFLDADLPENDPWDRTLTDFLYGGDTHYRICQEVVLGIGGVRMLNKLGYEEIGRYHMNEGHAAFLSLELLEESRQAAGRDTPMMADVHEVRKRCVFTTHTAVSAGHDRFPMDLVEQVLGHRDVFAMEDVFCCEGEVNMTFLALNLSRYINGVAKKHGEVSRHMFARYTIDSITNGVHAATWASEPFHALFDKHITGWREDNFSLRYALGIPGDEVWAAHQEAKRTLVSHVNRETNSGFDGDALTLGFARRMTAYKRPDLLLSDVARLQKIAGSKGPLQIVYAGKAHPTDRDGAEIIKRIFQAKKALADGVRLAFLENYDMEIGRMITAGVDVWLNTPNPPWEASGTSGMKAAVNGVPSLSVLDGWWVEGCIEGVTGWAIGTNGRAKQGTADHRRDGVALLDKLEQVVPLYYNDRDRFIEVMRHAIALNASFFNTQRMLQQYVLKAYFL